MNAFEQRLLQAIQRLGNNAYGVPLREAVGVSYGGLYVALDRLEERGYVVSHEGDPTPERGGRQKRFWRLTDKGRAALPSASAPPDTPAE